MKTEAIQLLEKYDLLKDDSDLRRFINNWMPERNQDYQQEYFLNDLERAIEEIISKKQ